jgi:hypothetical protein
MTKNLIILSHALFLAMATASFWHYEAMETAIFRQCGQFSKNIKSLNYACSSFVIASKRSLRGNPSTQSVQYLRFLIQLLYRFDRARTNR